MTTDLVGRLTRCARALEGQADTLAAIPDTRAYEDGRLLGRQIHIDRLREEAALLRKAAAASGDSGDRRPAEALDPDARAALAWTIARKIVGSCSGRHIAEIIAESLLAFPQVTPTVRMLASPAPEKGQP